jgi:hypothetical protein
MVNIPEFCCRNWEKIHENPQNSRGSVTRPGPNKREAYCSRKLTVRKGPKNNVIHYYRWHQFDQITEPYTHTGFLCCVDRASLIIWRITNSMHCLSSVYWVITSLYVSGVSAAHRQEAECIYVANGTCYTSLEFHSSQARWQSTQKYNKYHSPHIYILPPDDGLSIRPKHVEVL